MRGFHCAHGLFSRDRFPKFNQTVVRCCQFAQGVVFLMGACDLFSSNQHTGQRKTIAKSAGLRNRYLRKCRLTSSHRFCAVPARKSQ